MVLRNSQWTECRTSLASIKELPVKHALMALRSNVIVVRDEHRTADR
jgi:hypothetical protein